MIAPSDITATDKMVRKKTIVIALGSLHENSERFEARCLEHINF